MTGSMAAILNEALMPNLVQTAESTPAFVHGGPFANIAHGCNSILATRMALAMADYAVTEAGFAFDLGGEKFFDLKCRAAGLNPAAIVLVATVRRTQDARRGRAWRALKDVRSRRPSSEGSKTWPPTLTAPPISASRPSWRSINSAPTRAEELKVVHDYCAGRGVPCATADVFGEGGGGAIDLAEKVVAAASQPATAAPASLPARLAGRTEDRADRPHHVRRRRRDDPARRRGQDPKGRANWATANCRSAWPRPRIRSPIIPSFAADREVSRSPSATSRSPPVPGFWSH